MDTEIKDLSMKTLFTSSQVLRAVNITYRQLSYWELKGIIKPSYQKLGSRDFKRYTQQDIDTLTTVKNLLDEGYSLPSTDTLKEIAKRKEAEKALCESREKYRALVESSIDAIFIHDRDGRYLYANQACTRLFGKELDEILGKKLTDFFVKEKAKELLEAIQRVFYENDIIHIEYFVSVEGMVRYFFTTLTPIHSVQGDVISAMRVVRDITERKKAEESLKQRVEFEGTVSGISSRFVGISNIDDAINVSLADMGSLSGASRAYLFLFREDNTIMDNIHEWCAEGVSPQKDNLQGLPSDMVPWWMRKLRNGEVIHIKDVSKLPQEAKAERKILERQDIKSLLVLPLNIEGQLTGFIGFDNVVRTGEWSEDDLALLRISSEIIGNALERKKAEEELRESEEFNKRIIESSNDCIKVLDLEGRLLFMSRSGQQLMEINDITPYLNKSWVDFWQDEDRKAALEAISVAKNGGIGTFQGYNPTVKDTPKWWDIIITPILGSDNKVERLLSVSRDITERKKAEEEIKNLAKFPSENPNPVLRITKDGKVLYSNDAGKLLLAKWNSKVGEVVPERWRSIIADAFKFAKDGSKEEEEEEEVKDRVFSFTIASVKDAGYANLYARNITERKKAEKKLQESERHYRSLVENIELGVTLIDANRRIIMTNSTISRWFNKDSQWFVGRECFRGFEKRKAVCPHCPGTKAMANGRPTEVETEGVRDDGSRFPVRIHAFPLFDSDGSAKKFIEVVEDITERKKAEEEIKKSAEEWRRTFDAIADFVSIHDKDYNLVKVNKALADYLGKNSKELIGKKCFKVLHGTNEPWPTCPHTKTIKSKRSITAEIDDPNLRKKLLITTSPIFDDKGEFIGTVHVAKDITEKTK